MDIIPKPTDIVLAGETALDALFPGQRVEISEFRSTSKPPTLDDMIAAWAAAREGWLKSFESPNTRATYSFALDDFFRACGKYAWKIGRVDAMAWRDQLVEAGLKPATINLRLAALSSFFNFCENDWAVIDADGREVPLHNYQGQPAANPFGRIKRLSIPDTHRRKHLDGEQALALLEAVDRSTISGKRDYALLRTLLYTGYRNTEVRTLKFGNLVQEGGKVYHFWEGKGGKQRKEQLAPPAWEAIVDYLQTAGRLETMQPDDYIFTPLTDMALRLNKIDPKDWTRNRPLSIKEVGRIVKRYARLAGLDEKEVHPHTLRHSVAMNMRAVGFRIEEVGDKLHHANLDTTRIYDQMDGEDDIAWQTLQNRFKW